MAQSADPGVGVFLVGDHPKLIAALLKQSGLRLVGQVPNVTLLLPLLRDIPAGILLLTEGALEDWPLGQAVPRIRALNRRLRLAVVGDGAGEEVPGGLDWAFGHKATPSNVARALAAGPVDPGAATDAAGGLSFGASAPGAGAGGPGDGLAGDVPVGTAVNTATTRAVAAGAAANSMTAGATAVPEAMGRLLRVFALAARDPLTRTRGAAGQPRDDAGAGRNSILASTSASDSVRPAVVAVCGPKGGVGRTTLAVNLAVALARLHPGLALLVDLNLHAADAGLHLDLLEGPTLIDALPFLQEGSVEAILPYIQEHRASGLRVLLGPPRPELGDLVRREAAAPLVEVLRRRFPLIVVDLPAGCGDDVRVHVRQANHILLVTTLDPAALRQARFALEALEAPEQARVALVANRVRSDGPLSRWQAEDFLGIPIMAELPEDSAGLDQALLTGEPFQLRSGGLADRFDEVLQTLGLTQAKLGLPPRWRLRLGWR